MTSLHIHRLSSRFRLPPGAALRRQQLERIARGPLASALERALENLGGIGRAEVCIRRLIVPVRLRAGSSEGWITGQWSEALARSIRRAIEAAGTPSAAVSETRVSFDSIAGEGASNPRGEIEIVCFASPLAALVDMARGVANQDLRHAWAWTQLNLGSIDEQNPPEDAVREWVRVLAREPQTVVPTLATLARQDPAALGQLARRLTERQWLALVNAGLEAVHASVTWRAFEQVTRLGRTRSSQAPDCPTASPASARRIAATSRLAEVFQRLEWPEGKERFAAVFVLLESTPALAGEPPDVVLATVDALARRLSQGRMDPPSSGTDGPPSTRDGAAIENRSNPTKSVVPPHAVGTASGGFQHTGSTGHGGLLFLLNLFVPLDLPRRILASFEHRSFRGILCRLAARLAGTTTSDPAALAFSGFPPDAVPPDFEEEPLDEKETLALTTIADELEQLLVTRLGNLEVPPEERLDWLCRRTAVIVADPGWIEVNFPADAVSTDIRRTALDVDPGPVSWLGVVMKFRFGDE